MRTLIYGGHLIDPANRVDAHLNILIENGRVASVTEDMPNADERIDATGKVVCPGFIDIHMHEDPIENGRIYADTDRSIFHCMLRMGVTTAIGGNCGDNCCDPPPPDVRCLRQTLYDIRKSGDDPFDRHQKRYEPRAV